MKKQKVESEKSKVESSRHKKKRPFERFFSCIHAKSITTVRHSRE